MQRIDRSPMDRPGFGVTSVVHTRYDDLDTQGHVNNAAAAVILQEGRVRFSHAAGVLLADHGLRMVVASQLIEYAAEMRYPDPVELRTGLLEAGRSSLTLGQVARQNGRPSLYARTVLVVLGRAGPAPMPDALRAAMAAGCGEEAA